MSAISISSELEQRLRNASESSGESPDVILMAALELYLAQETSRFSSLGAGDDPNLDARQTRALLKDWHT